MNYRDVNRIIYIKNHCLAIESIINKHHQNKDEFLDDLEFQSSLMFYVLQIGELATSLSNEFRSDYPKIPWKEIIGTRNKIVHGYSKVNLDIIWNICSDDICVLLESISNIINENGIDDGYINYEI